MQDQAMLFKQHVEAHAEILLEHPSVGVAIFTPKGKLIYTNERFAKTYRLNGSDLYDRNIREVCRFSHQNLEHFITEINAQHSIDPQEIYLFGKYYLYKIQGIFFDQELFLVVTLMDVTNYKRTELALSQANQQLRENRTIDPITGLSNFSTFDGEIKKIYEMQQEETFGMLLLDVDQFKKFNAENGFKYGDIAIRKMSECLEELTQAHQYQLFHLGGDEFVILMRHIHEWNLYTFAEQVRIAIYNLNLYFSQGVDQRLTVSIAIQKYQTGHRFDIDFFLVKLKELLRVAKYQGGNCWIDHQLHNLAEGL